MNQEIAPGEIGAPAANYAHAVLVTDPKQWLYTAGVVPTDAGGVVPEGVPAQAAQVWQNLAAILAEAAMGPEDVVSVTTYVVADAMATGLGAAMAARDTFLGGRRVASTLVTVPHLAQPAWLLEVQLVAAR